MKRYPHTSTATRQLLSLAFAASCALPLPSLAAAVALASEPMATTTASTVKPNVMFILDDSGSMDWDYLPDWADDNHPVTNISYDNMPELFRNSGFNGVAYNPAITYKQPIFYNTDGTLNTTSYPHQNGLSAATGANTGYSLPNWRAVKNDGYGIQSTGLSNLEGNASHYVFIPGEYCSSDKMTSCVVATSPTTLSGTLYDKPAMLRWCNSSALTTCQSINNSTYRYPRYPGLVAPPTATLRVTSGNTATGITVNGFQILSGATASSTSTFTVASRIVTNINNCTAAIVGNCTIAGYRATRSGSTVTITAPVSLGLITYMPTATGSMSKIITAFTGGMLVPGSNVLTNIVSSNNSYPYPGSASKASTRVDCTGTTCTYREEMANYANWWAYYHTRMQAMKTSVSRAFKSLNSNYRVGFSTISYTGATDGTRFLGNNTFEKVHKNSWFSKLFSQDTPVATPLRGALSKAGRYYGNKIAGQVDPVQYSCQQNFTILSTDGYWNTNDESSSYGPDNLSGADVGNLDGGTTPRPMLEGTTAVSNTLADVSKYYYDTDLRTSTLSNCSGGISTDFPSGNPDVCSNNVFTSATDNNVKQHMTTFTMGLGADGTLTYQSDYDTATSGDFYNLKNNFLSTNWPDPINNSGAERIDDLWHAAVNGRGTYFSAKDPDQIVAGFTKALSAISAKLGSAAAAATSTLNPVAGNNFAYVASYTTVQWKGNLEARSINIDNGEVSETATWCVENIASQTCAAPGVIVVDGSGSSTVNNCVVSGATVDTCNAPGVFDATASTCTTQIANACSGTMPSKVGATSDIRKIFTANDAGTALIPFDETFATNNPDYFSAAHISGLNQWGTFNVTQQNAAAGVNLLRYLRGQSGYEDRSSNLAENRLYRAREATLGDALESQPAFIAKPTFGYTYSGYPDFRDDKSTRPGTVYMGTNDGMLHAFDGSTGEERWAYVPSLVIPNMWQLASTNYSSKHANFVNGSPIISDFYCTANCGGPGGAASWRTILVAGLSGGGRGYYALDITDPLSPSLLWEFNADKASPYGDPNLGYAFGRPVVTRTKDGDWVVLVTSGYNNGAISSNPSVANSPVGDGKGYLYVLDASTGEIKSKISTGVGDAVTPSGLAQIAVWNDAPAGNEAGYIYGGDLLGNLWRFELDGSMLLLSKFTNQPVTTTPILGSIKGHRVVFVGTGKYLEASDLTNKSVQSFYAIKDDGTTLASPRTNLIPQVISTDGATREVSSLQAVDFDSGRGWFADFPDVDSGSERQNIDGMLVSGVLIIPTIVPSSTVCTPGGYGWLNFFNFETGSVISEKFDSTIVGVNVIYIKGEPIVEVVTSSDPTPDIPNTDAGFSGGSSNFRGSRSIWRELIPPM